MILAESSNINHITDMVSFWSLPINLSSYDFKFKNVKPSLKLSISSGIYDKHIIGMIL